MAKAKRRIPKLDGTEQARVTEVQRRQRAAVRKRVATGESPLRIVGDVSKMPRPKKRGADPVGVRHVVSGGLPTHGKKR